MTKRSRLQYLVFLGALVALASCGSDDDSPADAGDASVQDSAAGGRSGRRADSSVADTSSESAVGGGSGQGGSAGQGGEGGAGGEAGQGGAGGEAGQGGAAGEGGAGGEAGKGGEGGAGGEAGKGGAGGEAGKGGAGGIGGAGGSAPPDCEGEGGSAGFPPAEEKRKSVKGTLVWELRFDDVAKADGAKDCSYERQYTGSEDRSTSWVCPTCEVPFKADVQTTSGLEECYKKYLSKSGPTPNEWFGVSPKAGTPDSHQFLWTPVAYVGAFDRGDATKTPKGFSVLYDSPRFARPDKKPGSFKFHVTGSFEVGEEAGDPRHGFTAPYCYVCGWDKANPPPYDGDYKLKRGATLPDAVMTDKCSQPYRIHDAKGKYIVLVVSAADCPGCRMLASDEPEAVADIRAAGKEVTVMTLLQRSLSGGLASTTLLNNWTKMFNLGGPVVTERDFGIFLMLQAYPKELGLPAWVVAAPDLKVIEWGVGADWDSIKAAIKDHTP